MPTLGALALKPWTAWVQYTWGATEVPEPGGWGQWLKSLWMWDVWQTIRPTFILLVGDAALFLLLMGFLALGHYVIEWVPASPERRVFLEQLHFALITGAWLFFSLTLFIELGLAFLRRMKEPSHSR